MFGLLGYGQAGRLVGNALSVLLTKGAYYPEITKSVVRCFIKEAMKVQFGKTFSSAIFSSLVSDLIYFPKKADGMTLCINMENAALVALAQLISTPIVDEVSSAAGNLACIYTGSPFVGGMCNIVIESCARACISTTTMQYCVSKIDERRRVLN